MREHTVDLKVSTQQDRQQMEAKTSQQPTQGASSVRKFIFDDMKLFVSPVTAIVSEFRRQVRL
jgi:hypothetical protein